MEIYSFGVLTRSMLSYPILDSSTSNYFSYDNYPWLYSTVLYQSNAIQQINRGNATVKARLAQLLTDSSSPNPRWLIKFDGLPLKDEEVYEHAFASPDNSNTDDDSDNSYSMIHHRGRGHGCEISSDNDTGDDRRHSRVRNHHPHSRHYDHSSSNNLASEESGGENSRVRAKRAMAREARSKRRQAKIEETMTTYCQNNHKRFRRLAPPPPDYHHPGSRTSSKGKRATSTSSNNNHNDDDEEVVQVKLLTGTLMLYKGLHRRAEFIRKVWNYVEWNAIKN